MNKGLLIVIALVVILGGAGFLFTRGMDLGTGSDSDGTPGSNGNGSREEKCPEPGPNVVSYCGGRFSSLTAAAGTSVTFKNDSTAAVEVSSDPHPFHTDNSELNIGLIRQGESKMVTLNRKGTWGVHNHLRETEKGTVIVQ